MARFFRRGGFGLITTLTLVTLSGAAVAQDAEDIAPEWVRRLAIDPESDSAKKFAAQQKVRVDAEKQMRKIRHQHFRGAKNAPNRQEGILKLREFEDPALFPSMIEVFGTEDADVRTALLDHFFDQQGDEGDASLSWMAVFDTDPSIRSGAEERLRSRIAKLGRTPDSLKLVIYEGIGSGKDKSMAAAAKLAASLSIIEAIPWLINGQVQGAQLGNVGDRDGALAWIMVGQQTAFVSDLQPVVGPSAVAFDPELSVINEGTLLRVVDAAVVTYHVDLNNALIDLTTKASGQPTKRLGWDVPAWREWYRKDFLPQLASKDAQAAPAAPDPK